VLFRSGLSPEEKESARRIVEQVNSASEKIASVIKRVMDFTKPAAPRLDPVDLNAAVEEAVRLSLAALRKKNIALETSLTPGLPAASADPHLIGQVLMNLITNAAQAMESMDSPRRIEVASSLADGRVVIRVSDSGPGVPLHLRNRIFDPFFTTRKEGYGIGLSFCHRVVTDHGGSLSVGTSRWGGAEFRIEIPAG
jgi:signal transduction histidine kinase